MPLLSSLLLEGSLDLLSRTQLQVLHQFIKAFEDSHTLCQCCLYLPSVPVTPLPHNYNSIPEPMLITPDLPVVEPLCDGQTSLQREVCAKQCRASVRKMTRPRTSADPKPPRHLPVHRGHLASIAVYWCCCRSTQGGKGDHVLV